MLVERQWPAFIMAGLIQPEARAAVDARGRQAREEIHYAFRALDLLGAEAAILGHGLRAEGNLALATPVALVATVLRQQVEMASGTEWFPGYSGASSDSWEEDLSLEDLRSLPGLEAAAALGEELQTLALFLANASNCVPGPWTCKLLRCVGSLFLVLAQLREVVDTHSSQRCEKECETV
jgi:hypothetical protein